MTRLLLAAALCAAWAGQGAANDAAFMLAQIGGEAFAFAEKCPSVRVDTGALAALTVKMGVNEADISGRDLRYFYGKTLEAWGGRSVADACDAADLLYGTKGSMAAGILAPGG